MLHASVSTPGKGPLESAEWCLRQLTCTPPNHTVSVPYRLGAHIDDIAQAASPSHFVTVSTSHCVWAVCEF